MKKLFLISIILIAFLSISSISAADDNLTDNQNTNTTISDIADGNADKLESINVSGNSFEDIQNTVNKAQSNCTITLNDTYVGSGKEITISKPLTIEGKGSATLDGNFTSKIFNINAKVTLKNLNFINCRSITNGGAIFSNGELTIINCNFTNNAVDSAYDWYFNTHNHDYELEEIGKGGAIYSTNALTVINSSFTDNSAVCNITSREMDMYYENDEGSASAIYCEGKLYLEKSKFSGNKEFVIEAHNNSQVIECIFENQGQSFSNYGDYYGKSNTTFIRCLFNNCEFDRYQSEIYLGAGDGYFDNCNFTNVKKILLTYGNCEIANSLFTNITTKYNGDSAINIKGLAKITNSTFKNNHVGNTAIMELGSYELNNCTFINNTDATILSGDYLLDDDLNKIYLFKMEIVNKLSKVYYSSGKIISVKSSNIFTKELNYYWSYEVYRNGKAFYDYWNGEMMKLPVSTWKAGTYTIVVKATDSYTAPEKLTFKVTVLKAPTTVKAPKITAKYKKSKYFKITVKNKVTKKAAKNLKIKVKVYTGKKYKTFNLKTNKNGIAKLNTKSLKIGKHKVVISSGNSNYKVSSKSQITIKK